MSESMAFIGGVAVAGLAAIVLLKGNSSPIPQSGFTLPSQSQPQLVTPPVITQPGQYGVGQNQPNLLPSDPNNTQLRIENERLKMQVDNMVRENERVKAENQQIQFQLQNYNNQAQLNAIRDQSQNQLTQSQQPQSPWWSSGIIWAVGGMAITVGGGIVVAGVSALFSPKQRQPRTVQVIHPYTNQIPPMVPTRRTEFLPPRNEVRRVETPEYDDLY
jgi:hypothetical protein